MERFKTKEGVVYSMGNYSKKLLRYSAVRHGLTPHDHMIR
jgi:hypothetical protein